MILQRLVEYYDRLQHDEDDPVPPFGFSREKISFAIVIDPDGSKPEITDLRVEAGKKPRPRILEMPDRGGRSGTKLWPFFLWDNTGYVLGSDSKGKGKRAEAMSAEFKKLHHMMAALVDDDGLAAVCKFLDSWSPSQTTSLALWDEAIDTNLVFQIRGKKKFVHESAELRKAWLKHRGTEIVFTQGNNLLNGRSDRIAQLHPMISSVAGAQTTGAAIASFNLDAFESYGRTQTYNAPVSVEDAFRYTTALNRLLERGRRKVILGDATVVYWSSEPTPEENLLADFFAEEFVEKEKKGSAEDRSRVREIQNFINQLKQGHQAGSAVDESDAAPRFYILGLSPNASRLSIRFWFDGTVSELRRKLGQHVADMELVGQRDTDPPLTVKRIVQSTGRATSEYGNYDSDTVSPLLAGAITRAILTGGPHPSLLLGAMLNRIRADGVVRHERVAAIKACLNRNSRLQGKPLEVPVSLDLNRTDSPYITGRLFALLEKIQSDSAGGDLNATIKDRYFSAASATPATVFPRLVRLTQHHLAKLETGPKIFYERLLGEVIGKLDAFARHMPLEAQGLFAIGYYHQRQDLFRKREKEGASE